MELESKDRSKRDLEKAASPRGTIQQAMAVTATSPELEYQQLVLPHLTVYFEPCWVVEIIDHRCHEIAKTGRVAGPESWMLDRAGVEIEGMRSGSFVRLAARFRRAAFVLLASIQSSHTTE